MVRIGHFTSRVQAEVARSMLTAHGIDARLAADDAGGLHPDLAYGFGLTALVVADGHADEARALLESGTAPPTTGAEADDLDAARRAGRRSWRGTLALALAVALAVAVLFGNLNVVLAR